VRLYESTHAQHLCRRTPLVQTHGRASLRIATHEQKKSKFLSYIQKKIVYLQWEFENLKMWE